MKLNAIDQGEGPLIILLHGLFGAAKNLGAIARGLSAQARVISLDLRNHGGSPHDARMDYPLLARDVAETAAAMGAATARVVGHSMGGKAAMALALCQPEFVEKLVVMDIAPVAYPDEYDAYLRAMKRVPLAASLTRHQADAVLAEAIAAPPLRGFLLNNLILGASPHWRIGLDEIAAAMPGIVAWNNPPGARPYPGPTLFLRGGNSDYVPDSARPVIAESFPGAKIETIADAGHWLHADQPKAVIAALKEFLFP